MRSREPLRGGNSAALLSGALWDCGINLPSRRAAALAGSGGRWKMALAGAAWGALAIAPAAAQPGVYGNPYAGPPYPYAGPYQAGPQGSPYGEPPQPYGYGSAGGFEQPAYPRQPMQYPQAPAYQQQPFSQFQSPQPGYGPLQYGQQEYGQPDGYGAQGYGDPQQDFGEPQSGFGIGLGAGEDDEEAEQGQAQAQALDPTQLDQLVAPIALYPDALLAQVLTAATYPAQVAAADAWLDGLGNAPPDQVAAGANAHSDWDPSIKSLTAFPQVLDMMARNLQWTTDLGNAYYNQPQDLMQTVQVLRQRAEDAGNLRSTPQEPLNYQNGYIELEPPNDQTAYVPQYDPWTVYGDQISPYQGFSLGDAVGSFLQSGLGQNVISYGLGSALGAFNNMPWGFLGWGLNWLANSVLFNHSDYFTQSTSVADWGLRYGGPRAYGRGGDWGWRGRGDYGRGGYGWDRGHDGGRGERGWDRGYGSGRDGRGFDRGFGRGEAFAGGGSREFYGWRGNEHLNPRFGGEHGGRMPEFGSHEAFGRPEPRFGGPSVGSHGQGFHGGFGSYGHNGDGRGYAGRPGMAFANPGRGFEAPRNFGRGNGFDGRGYGGYGGSFGKPQKSGGFHWFGRGHNSDGYGGGRASHGFFGGGQSPRGFDHGGFGGGKMPKQHSFGGGHFGGGHFGGGHSGGHFGGGHSGGGHSGGGHGGSHHH